MAKHMRKEGENDVEVVICDVKLANLENSTSWNQYSLYEKSDVRTDQNRFRQTSAVRTYAYFESFNRLSKFMYKIHDKGNNRASNLEIHNQSDKEPVFLKNLFRWMT